MFSLDNPILQYKVQSDSSNIDVYYDHQVWCKIKSCKSSSSNHSTGKSPPRHSIPHYKQQDSPKMKAWLKMTICALLHLVFAAAQLEPHAECSVVW